MEKWQQNGRKIQRKEKEVDVPVREVCGYKMDVTGL
jgi:hypothetical protein